MSSPENYFPTAAAAIADEYQRIVIESLASGTAIPPFPELTLQRHLDNTRTAELFTLRRERKHTSLNPDSLQQRIICKFDAKLSDRSRGGSIASLVYVIGDTVPAESKAA